MGKPYPKDRDRKPVKVIKVKMVGPKARSVKKQREMLARHKLRVQLQSERGDWCEAKLPACSGRWTDMHELLARSQGGDPLDPNNIALLCRGCHRWLTDHPKQALELGFRESRQVQNV